MSEIITKADLLENLRSGHANLQAVLDGLTEGQMTQSGVIGDWSMKDLLAHFTYWERRAAFLLTSAIDGYREADDIWKLGSVDDQNGRNFEKNTARPLADVLADWRSTFQTLLSLIERLPEERLADTSRFGWQQDESLGERIAGESFGHIEEHWPDLQAWLDKLPH